MFLDGTSIACEQCVNGRPIMDMLLLYSFLKATTKEPVELKRKIESEQADMHRRMVTSDGHLLIELARCCADEPDAIERKFPEVNKDIGPILRNLDKQVTTLIADTPIITDDAPLPM